MFIVDMLSDEAAASDNDGALAKLLNEPFQF
jgi:hypothetical protein